MNDNEPTRWTSIGWQTALILNRLRNEKQVQAAQRDADQRNESDDEGDRGKLAIFRR